MPDCLHAQPHEVSRAQVLQDDKRDGDSFDKCPDTERDRTDQHQDPGQIAGGGGERQPPAKRDGATQDGDPIPVA